MKGNTPFLIHIDEQQDIATSHGIGRKKVLFNHENWTSDITQIAETELKAGEKVEGHVHPTMDEHFVFLSGHCLVKVGDVDYDCKGNTYLCIPAGFNHSLSIINDTKMITIGVATD